MAENSTQNYRLGAIVVKNGNICGRGWNRFRNHPNQLDNKFVKHCASVHAEVAALRAAGFPRNCTVYVARILRNGETALSKPCINCQRVLDACQAKVVFSL